MKEYIIRIDDPKHDKMLVRKLKALCKEYEGEYYTKTIDKRYIMGMVQTTPKAKDTTLFNERVAR